MYLNFYMSLGSTCISSLETEHSKLQNLKNKGLELSWDKRIES